MSAQTGENEQALRKILDLTRMLSMAVLVLHCYYYCYGAFVEWHLTSKFTAHILRNISNTGLFKSLLTSKLLSLALLTVSLVGARGKKEEQLKIGRSLKSIGFGLAFFVGSVLLLRITGGYQLLAIFYLAVTIIGYLFILRGGSLLSRVIIQQLNNADIFNKENETFPQEERCLENEFSVNLPASYRLKNKIRKSWVNFINPFRGILVLGTPGAGKSYFVIRHVITQLMAKQFSMFIYDFKFDDLSVIAYNHFLKNISVYPASTEFYVINFDDLSRSHRCNPLDKENMLDVTDAAESARTILMGLNREWIRRQGDFFVESPINFLTAIIWFLRRYNNGEFCTLPHAIELMQMDYDKLFSILRTESQIEVLVNPFVSAYVNGALEQLEGQVAAAKIAMARLSSPQLYYVLSGNDFTLDINNPEAPKIVCMGNNPQKIQVYGAVLSLYVNRLIKLVNKRNKLASCLVFDEFPTIYLNNIDSLIATARSNKVATCLGVQDFSQLKKDYGKDQADVIMNITGNIISGQVAGETAKQLSERFGKILQDRSSLTINRNDTSVSKSKQLENAIPPSRISNLSAGEFVGLVADEPASTVELKAFHCNLCNDHKSIKAEEDLYVPLPVIRSVSNPLIQANYLQVKKDIQDLVIENLQKMMENPELTSLIVRK